MFAFVQNIFAPPAHPIGVDFGIGTLRMAQVQSEGDDFKLLAAASAEVPAAIREDADARFEFFARTVRDLIVHGKFHGRRAVLGLPSAVVHTQHLSVLRADEDQLKKLIHKEAKAKLPFDPDHALLRHAAGPGGDKKNQSVHAVVMAADARWVNQYIAAAKQARLDVVGMNMQPMALLDCFASVYRRNSDRLSVRMYVDIGAGGTRVAIGQATRLLLARNLAIGGDRLTAAVAEAMGISMQDARTLRIKLGAGGGENGERVEAICAQAIDQLAAEIQRCRCEHEAAFPNLKVQRLIFVGGEARLESMCQFIAEKLGLPGQTGDSLCRMARNSRIGIESAIDRRHPQPAWAAAIGLSIGPPLPD